jgi:hypothetical protein
LVIGVGAVAVAVVVLVADDGGVDVADAPYILMKRVQSFRLNV